MHVNATVTALVVTYNRKDLLMRCLSALDRQSRKPDRIVIVDNASADGTREALSASGWLHRDDVELLALPENTGGAGGFAAGLRQAMHAGSDWVWMMDDDAEPFDDALEALCHIDREPQSIYGSTAICGNELAWPMTPADGASADVRERLEQLGDLLDVRFLPFLGLMISRQLVERIGVPDAGFFIAADDLDYCYRARSAGARIWLVSASRVEHPTANRYWISIAGRRFCMWRLPPWKRYYDVRNRMFISSKHHGSAHYLTTIPSQVVRFFATMIFEADRRRQAKSFFAGMVDGFLGRKGRRHDLWGILP